MYSLCHMGHRSNGDFQKRKNRRKKITIGYVWSMSYGPIDLMVIFKK